MLSTDTKRPIWQLRLSTAVVLSMIAGGLMYLNFRPDQIQQLGPGSVHVTGGGWPLPSYSITIDRATTEEAIAVFQQDHQHVSVLVIVLNIVACLALLALSGAVIEWATRRMKRKPTP